MGAQVESPTIGKEAELVDLHYAECQTEDLITKVTALEAVIDAQISILLEKEVNRLILCSADYKVMWKNEYRRGVLLECLVPPRRP